MAIRPLGQRVLVKPVKKDYRFNGGIYLPETAEQKRFVATVIALGHGLEDTLRIGDIVFHSPYGGNNIQEDGEDLLLLDLDDIYAIIDKEETEEE